MVGRIPCWLVVGCVALVGVGCGGEEAASTSSSTPGETASPSVSQGTATEAAEAEPQPTSTAASPIQQASLEQTAPKQEERAPIYDTKADANAQIPAAQDAEDALDDALKQASAQDKRVLVHLGAPW